MYDELDSKLLTLSGKVIEYNGNTSSYQEETRDVPSVSYNSSISHSSVILKDIRLQNANLERSHQDLLHKTSRTIVSARETALCLLI